MAKHWTKSGSNSMRGGLAPRARPVSLASPEASERDYPLWSELTPRMKVKFQKFLKQVEKTGALTKARKRCKLGRSSIRAMRRNPEFESKVLDAIAAFTERMELKVDERAFKGVDDPVFFEGEVVGHRKKYSDVLAMFRLRGLAPEKYAERHQHGGVVEHQHSIMVYIPDNQRDPHLSKAIPQAAPADPNIIEGTGQVLDEED